MENSATDSLTSHLHGMPCSSSSIHPFFITLQLESLGFVSFVWGFQIACMWEKVKVLLKGM
jgi:hypothetical protein